MWAFIATKIIFHFLLGENARISMALSKQNIQSRFIIEFDKIGQLVDTPNHTIQGFIMNMQCDRIELIFPDRLQDNYLDATFIDNNLWLFVDNNIDSSVNDTLVSFHIQNKISSHIINQIEMFAGFFRSTIQSFTCISIEWFIYCETNSTDSNEVVTFRCL